MTPRRSAWTIHINIFVILQNLFIMLCLFSESDQLKLPQHYAHPMSNSFGTCSITIMPSMIEEDGKLGFNWNLWDMQIVVEDMVVVYLLDDAIEGGWVHANLVPELVDVPIMPSHK